MVHVEDLKVDGGINWRWCGRHPSVLGNLLTFSNWEERIYKERFMY